MKHEELIERLQGLDGPDREVMLAAFDAFHPNDDAEGYDDKLFRFVAMLNAEAWESAALTLVPEGWKLRQMNLSAPCADDRKWWLNLYGGKTGEDTFTGSGATPAIAIVIAALKALQDRRP